MPWLLSTTHVSTSLRPYQVNLSFPANAFSKELAISKVKSEALTAEGKKKNVREAGITISISFYFTALTRPGL